MVWEQRKRRRTSVEVLKTCPVESLHVFEINEDGYRTFLVSDSPKMEVLSVFSFLSPPLIYDKLWYMLNRHIVKLTCLVKVFQSSEIFLNDIRWVLQSKCSSLNLTEWISGVSDLEVTLRLTYPLTAGAPNCFTVYSHLAKGVKTDSKHPVMKLISWETVSLISSVLSMTNFRLNDGSWSESHGAGACLNSTFASLTLEKKVGTPDAWP